MQAEPGELQAGGAKGGGARQWRVAYELVTLDADRNRIVGRILVDHMPEATEVHLGSVGIGGEGDEVLDFLPNLDGTGGATHQNIARADVVGLEGLGNAPCSCLSQLDRQRDVEAMDLVRIARYHWSSLIR